MPRATQLSLPTVDEQAAYLVAHGITDRRGHEHDRHHRDVDPKVLYAVLGLKRRDNESDGALATVRVVSCNKGHANGPTAPKAVAWPLADAVDYVHRLRDAAKAVLNKVNVEPYAAYDKLVERIVTNVRNRVSYERLADHGPKLGPITAKCPLVATYFTRLAVPESAKAWGLR